MIFTVVNRFDFFKQKIAKTVVSVTCVSDYRPATSAPTLGIARKVKSRDHGTGTGTNPEVPCITTRDLRLISEQDRAGQAL